MDNLNEIYRVQGSEKNNPFLNPACPIKRVLVSNTGKIKLNPDSEHFIYFSRSKRHHSYYLYSKVLKIISKEIDLLRNSPMGESLKIPADFRAFRYYSHLNYDDIKRVKDLLTNYTSPQDVELITMSHMPAFSELFEYCATKNHQKDFGKNYPEISDTSTFGGAYGINNIWLELLKQCTVETKTANISLVEVLEELLQFKNSIKVSDQRLKSVLNCNEALFEILDHLSYKNLTNPEFVDKNTINKITYLLELIEEYRSYNPKLDVNRQFFVNQRKKFKDEYHKILEAVK